MQRFDGPRYYFETTDLKERVDLVTGIIASRIEASRSESKRRSLH